MDSELSADFSVHEVTSARDALRAIELSPPSIVLLDAQLGDADGTDLCRALRAGPATSHLPIIITCDGCGELDRIRGLRVGADDFYCGILSSPELQERMRAAIRRATRAAAPPRLYAGGRLFADFDGCEIRVDGDLIMLTRRELALLEYMVAHRNRVLTRQELLDGVWHAVSVNDRRTVDTHVRRLRSKLRTVGGQIRTLAGIGYRFVGNLAITVASALEFALSIDY